jgi:hypothetical protein
MAARRKNAITGSAAYNPQSARGRTAHALERSIAMRNTSCASRIESIDSLPMMGRKAARMGARGEEIFIGY